MRLYQASSLYEYIKQLEKDVSVLKELKAKFDKGDFGFVGTEEFNKNRDTFENHADMIAKHYDTVRRARNKSNEGT